MDNISNIREVKLYLFDMDGILYLGDNLYDFTTKLLKTIKQTGGKYWYDDYEIKAHKGDSIFCLPICI